MAPFRVLTTYNFFEPGFRAGGPVRSIARILDTCSEQTSVTMVTGDRDLGAREPYPGLSGRWVTRGRARIFYLCPRRPGQWWALWRALRQGHFDLLYANGMFATYSIALVLAARYGLVRSTRLVIAPRGEFEPACLSRRPLKKRCFLWWWGRLLRHRADVAWHATSPLEATRIAAVFPWARIEVSPVQVALPAEPIEAAPHHGVPRLVFVGRILPSKNVALLVEALALVGAPVSVDLYGPVEDAAYWARCRRLIAGLPAHVDLRYHGELRPEVVRETFARYDAFLMPTLGENFGHVIAESLSASCPVLCSDRTPWGPVLAAGGGTVIRELTPQAWAREIDRLLGRSATARHDARRAAGAAYRTWRSSVDGPNVLDRLRLRQGALPAGATTSEPVPAASPGTR
ncbi:MULTISPECIES: glycosyltransferase [Micromonospora]|uniref:glycosyltransferase n=1 Tax=Micromonospora TaxID=1873 RepID=UPI001585E3C5|nr:glycosyltransferase [Micromonospora yangpuensis]